MAAAPVNPGQSVPSGGAGSQNLNPLGSSVFSNLSASSPISATLPNMGSGAPGSGGLVPGGAGTAPGINTTATSGSDFSMLGDYQQTYGRGTGTQLATTVGNLGTNYSEALGIMNNATINAAQRQFGNVEAQMAAAGVDPGSSAYALASSDFSSHLTDTLSANAAQLGLQEESMKLNSLTGEGQAHGSDVSGWDQFGEVMQGLGSAAIGLGESYFLGGGSLGSIGKSLGGLFGGGAKQAVEGIGKTIAGSGE